MENRMILLVEDNADDEVLTLRSLRKASVENEIKVVRDGEAALDFLFGRDGKGGCDASGMPHLILLDLKLPKVSGLEVLQAIRGDTRTRRIPVVILTSSTEEVDMKDGYDLGVNSFVSKPVNFHEFGKAVQDLGCYWLLINQVPHN